MRRFPSVLIRCGLVAAPLVTGSAHRLLAQIGVSFTPASGSWVTGTPVSVTIKFCANPEQWYLSHWITFNSVDVTGSFSSGSGSDGSCVFLQYWTGTVTMTSGTNTLSAGFTAAYFDGADVYYETSFSNSAYYTGTAPVDVPALEDYSRCALNCFAATYAQGTVPYYSLDTPRNVTLVYNGDRVDPRPFVNVDYTISGTLPSWLQPRLHRVGGADITFLNGETALRFSAPGAGTWRLGGQFSSITNGMSATDAYLVEVFVGQMIGGNLQETLVETRRLLVVNEAGSPVARGWTLAGIQRLYPISGGGALITEGDGSAVYFAWNGSSFVAPAGEFSRLTGSGGWVRAYPDSTKVTFSANGYMTSVADRFGNTTTVGYTGANVTSITDPYGITQTLAYGSYGLSSVTALGRTSQVQVDDQRRLLSMTDPDAVSTVFGYDGGLRLWTVTDRVGATTTLGYDNQSFRLSSITAPAVWIFGEQDYVSPVTALVAWQKAGVPYVATSGTPFVPVPTSQVQATVTDPDGHTTSFTVNRLGQPLVTTHPLGGTTTASYTSSFLPTAVTHPTGGADTILYNADGLPTWVQTAGRPATNIAYTPGRWAQPDSTWGAGQPTVRFTIGANGRITAGTVAGGPATTYLYESRGRIERVTDPEGHLLGKTLYLGTNGNRSRDSLPGNRTITYGYDSYGRTISVSPSGLPTRSMTYDVINRALTRSDGVNPDPTRFFYGATFVSAFVTDSVQDPAGQVYRFGFNALGWLARRTDPAGRDEWRIYDRDGNLRRWWNRRGQQITYTYDALHRLAGKSGVNTATESWSYSSNTRVITGTSPVSTETQYFNVMGAPDSVVTMLAGQPFMRRYYYSLGRLDSMRTTGNSLTFLGRNYSYDATRGTVSGITLPNVGTTTIQRNDDFLVSGVTYPQGDLVTRDYSPLHGTAVLGTTAGYADAVTRGVGYDLVGRVQRQVMPNQQQGSGYTYDGLSRLRTDSVIVPPTPACSPPLLVGENGASCVSDLGWYGVAGQVFSHDAVGNRLDHGGGYTTGHRITAFDNCTYQTDYDGNVTQRSCQVGQTVQTVNYTWSAENRLISVDQGGTNVAGYQYDAFGRLLRQDLQGFGQRHFLWNGDDLLAELNNNVAVKVGEYSYFGGLDNLHAFIVGSTPYYAHRDALGNTIALTSQQTSVARTYFYDVWGTNTGGYDAGFGNADRARWKGALWMGPETDLYYMRNRWYEPRTGRFLSEDPIGLAGGLNPYAFAAGDPVNMRDPSGRSCEMVYLTREVDDGGGGVIRVRGLEVVCTSGGDWFGDRTSGWSSGFVGWRGANAAGAFRGPWAGGGGGANRLCRNFTQEQCNRIFDAIAFLRNHPAAQCRLLGEHALARYHDLTVAFANGFDGEPTWYGWSWPGHPERDVFLSTRLHNQAVQPVAGLDPGELANTIAHEMAHMHLVGGDDAAAEAIGNACAGPI